MLASTHHTRILAAIALAVPLLAAGAAQARVKPYYWQNYETRGPARGYEGYAAPN